jgi:hypothetical protein
VTAAGAEHTPDTHCFNRPKLIRGIQESARTLAHLGVVGFRENNHVHPIVFAYPSRLPRSFGCHRRHKPGSGKYAHRIVTGGVGHNPPQAFAEAGIDVAKS